MQGHPYKPEIVITFLLAPMILAIEAWRRWDELLSPVALDDALVFGAAMIVAWRLRHRETNAPIYWVFVCGGAWFLLALSLWGSIYAYDVPDPSGAPVPLVVAFKAVGFILVTLAGKRAVARLRLRDPYAHSEPQ